MKLTIPKGRIVIFDLWLWQFNLFHNMNEELYKRGYRFITADFGWLGHSYYYEKLQQNSVKRN
jgi:hypothetical protein